MNINGDNNMNSNDRDRGQPTDHRLQGTADNVAREQQARTSGLLKDTIRDVRFCSTNEVSIATLRFVRRSSIGSPNEVSNVTATAPVPTLPVRRSSIDSPPNEVSTATSRYIGSSMIGTPAEWQQEIKNSRGEAILNAEWSRALLQRDAEKEYAIDLAKAHKREIDKLLMSEISMNNKFIRDYFGGENARKECDETHKRETDKFVMSEISMSNKFMKDYFGGENAEKECDEAHKRETNKFVMSEISMNNKFIKDYFGGENAEKECDEAHNCETDKFVMSKISQNNKFIRD